MKKMKRQDQQCVTQKLTISHMLQIGQEKRSEDEEARNGPRTKHDNNHFLIVQAREDRENQQAARDSIVTQQAARDSIVTIIQERHFTNVELTDRLSSAWPNNS